MKRVQPREIPCEGYGISTATERASVSACPECGSEVETAHHHGDGYAPECHYNYCPDCGWQGEPE